MCAGNTICAYLQANARGINTQQLCTCPGAHRCPLLWDSEDGHSITQGSDQYKVRLAVVLRVSGPVSERDRSMRSAGIAFNAALHKRASVTALSSQ